MISRHAFGGDVATQAAVYVLVLATTAGLSLAYINIKNLQIEQHRAWMLRTMFYLGTIITTRLIMIIAAQITICPQVVQCSHDLRRAWDNAWVQLPR